MGREIKLAIAGDPTLERFTNLDRIAREVREKYRMAFLAQTGLSPSEVVMLYGEEIVEEHGHLCKKFKVRFIPQSLSKEIKELQNQVAFLAQKNHAMQLVLSPLSIRAGISEDQLMELLEAAEQEVISGANGTSSGDVPEAAGANGGSATPAADDHQTC
jgi:hypothetical protein